MRVHGHFHGKAVDQHFVHRHIRKFLRHLAALLGEHTAHQPVDRLLVHGGHQFHLARARDLERRARHAIRALARNHARADGNFIVGPELARARDYGVGRLHALGDLAQEHDIHVLVHRGNVRIRLHRLDVGVEFKALPHRRHDPRGVVARVGVVADGAAQPAIDFFQLRLRLLRKRMAMQLMPALADGVLAPLNIETGFGGGGFHDLHRFRHDFKADVIAQQNSNF